MNKRLFSIAAVGAVSFALSGCVSVVKVKKAEDGTKGLRYFLPKVFIQVTPSSDGTITVEKVYLPDPGREYAISADSYLSAYTLDVERDEKGFLKTVTFNTDSTAVASQLITSAANVRAAQVEARTAKAKSEADEIKANADKAKTALDTADKARKEAALAVEVLQRKLDLLKSRKTEADPPKDIDDQIFSVRLAMVEAQAKADAANAGYADLLSKAQIVSTNSANAPGEEKSWPQAMEPVFYRVDMTKDTVQLRQAFAQNSRSTWVVPKVDSSPELALLPTSIVVRSVDKTGALSKKVGVTLPAKAVVADSFVRMNGKVVMSVLPVLSLQSDRVTIEIEVPKSTPAGDYELDVLVTLTRPDDAKPVRKTIQIRVEK